MVIVNSAAIINNYEVGTIINERKIWGNKYIEKLEFKELERLKPLFTS